MSTLKVKEEGFSELISNPAGLPVKNECSNQIRKEHNRWKKDVSVAKQEKPVESMSYWQVVSASVSL